MKPQILDNTCFITYSNYFKIQNRTFSFRKQVLFEVTNIPLKLELKDNGGSKGYWINRDWFSISKIQRIVVKEEISVDVSSLQWYQQINLDHVFNF
jgi:hypothetical protein